MSWSVAFATSGALPNGAPDDRSTIETLRSLKVDAEPSIWDDPSVDWSRFDAVILRSTWDYPRRPTEFLRFLDHVDAATHLWNPIQLVRWNSHKGYLLDLPARGLEIVPTELVRPARPQRLEEIRASRGWRDVVLKPSIGADALGLLVVLERDTEEGERHLRRLLDQGEVLVQPFLEESRSEGEISLVFFDGRFSHALRYPFVLGGAPRDGPSIRPEPHLVEAVQRVLRTLSHPTLYARADFLPAGSGRWQLGELELIEPELFLRADPKAPARFARAISKWLERGRGPPEARARGSTRALREGRTGRSTPTSRTRRT